MSRPIGAKNKIPHFIIDENRLKDAYKLGALGLTMEEIGRFWDIPARTFNRYASNNLELKAQIKKGKTEADLTVIQALLQQCKEGNVVAAIFWLKNRQPDKWKDRHDFKGEGFETKVFITNVKHILENAHRNNKQKIGIESPAELERKSADII